MKDILKRLIFYDGSCTSINCLDCPFRDENCLEWTNEETVKRARNLLKKIEEEEKICTKEDC